MVEPTIYIVEDDAAVRAATRRLLRTMGHPVQDFASAEDFLTATDSESRGCLVLDLSLPGMNGLQLQKELAARKSDLRIVFMTSHFDPASEKAALRGAIAFLRKPFGPKQLQTHVRTAMSDLRKETA